jgi:hypothetical protein
MKNNDTLDLIRVMISEAIILASQDHVMVRVSGERIAVILADLLYEIDTELTEVISLLPSQRRLLS